MEVSTSSAVPPLRSIRRHTHSPARRTSPQRSASALTDGIDIELGELRNERVGVRGHAGTLVMRALPGTGYATSRTFAASASARSFFRL